MRTLWNLALRLAVGREAGNLWRQIALPAAILISVVLTTSTLSILNVLQREDQRSLDRNIAEAVQADSSVSGSTPGLYVASGLDYWRGEQFLLYWFEPPGGGNFVLPPGIERLPERGEAVVSPAFAREIEQYPELQARYPRITVLHQSGVVSADELIAWVRPVDPEAFTQHRSTSFVTRFNADSEHPTPYRSSLSSPTNFPQAYLFAAIVVFLPSLLLLVIGMSASSSVREARVELLQELGAGRSWVMRLNLLEAMIFATPILLVILPILQYASAQLDTIPIIDRSVFVGDMRLSWLQIGLIALLTLAAIAIAAVGQVAFRAFRVDRWRFWRPVTITVRLMLIGAAVYVGVVLARSAAERGLIVFMANLLIVLAILPTIVGQLAGPVGSILARSKRLPIQISGERLRYLSSASLRPFVGIAMAIVIVLLGFAQIAYLTERLPYVDHSRAPSSAEVRANASYADIQRAVQERLPDTLTFPMYEPADMTPGSLPVYRFGVACEDVATYLGFSTTVCSGSTPPTAAIFVPTIYYGYGEAMFDPSLADVRQEPGSIPPALMVVSRSSMDQIDRDVRSALPPAEYPGLNVASPESFTLRVPPQAPWIERGATAFVIVASLVMMGALVDQAISERHHGRQLVAIGSPKSTLLSVEGCSFAVPTLVAVIVGFTFGLAELALMRRIIGFPWADVPFLPLGISLIVLLCIAAALIMFINGRIAFAEGGNTQ